MSLHEDPLTDSFDRRHTYLRISLTERCNFRCTYCMPAGGVPQPPDERLMSAEEVFAIAKKFVDLGVRKIRLTGGEPLVRKDFGSILRQLSTLDVTIGISTNGVLVDKYLSLFNELDVKNINVSLDSLDSEKFASITRRDDFERVRGNLDMLLREGFHVKVNTVLIKGFNEDEIEDFIHLTREQRLHVRFIEFMPFDGNEWKKEKLVSYEEILDRVAAGFPAEDIIRIADRPNDTSRNYRIRDYRGTFAVISTMTNPFCDTCNRIRLTADGRLKNCLFSEAETDLLNAFRNQGNIDELIKLTLLSKHKMRAGMDTPGKIENPEFHTRNRSMIAIGG